MAKRGSIIMKSNPLDELEDEKDDGKKETLFFNKGKKVNFKDEYSYQAVKPWLTLSLSLFQTVRVKL